MGCGCLITPKALMSAADMLSLACQLQRTPARGMMDPAGPGRCQRGVNHPAVTTLLAKLDFIGRRPRGSTDVASSTKQSTSKLELNSATSYLRC